MGPYADRRVKAAGGYAYGTIGATRATRRATGARGPES
jgi:hypothetical protein